MTISDIAGAIGEYAPLRLQESWDNSGWQVTPTDISSECSGVMLCLDITPAVVAQAAAEGCNLIISHHPLLFKAVRSLTGATPPERSVMMAVAAGIDIYSSHTALDCAPQWGVSRVLGEALGLRDMHVLVPSDSDPGAGLGVTGGICGKEISMTAVIDRIKEVYGAPRVRVTRGRPDAWDSPVGKVALCSGSGGEFIPQAIAAGADVYITSDVRYHDFLDYGERIVIVDVSHYESEICTKSIFSKIISQKFPNFAIRMATCERNPVAII